MRKRRLLDSISFIITHTVCVYSVVLPCTPSWWLHRDECVCWSVNQMSAKWRAGCSLMARTVRPSVILLSDLRSLRKKFKNWEQEKKNWGPTTFVRNYEAVFVFTALHGMQTRSSDGNSVCPSVYSSVRPSVCLSNARIVTKRKKDLSFWEECWWRRPFYLKFWVNRHALERNRRFWIHNRS